MEAAAAQVVHASNDLQREGKHSLYERMSILRLPIADECSPLACLDDRDSMAHEKRRLQARESFLRAGYEEKLAYALRMRSRTTSTF